MKAVRSALLCAAIAGAMTAAAAEPVATIRLKSLGAVLDVVRDGAALAGQPFAAVMAESMLRSQISQTGVEIREDDPILFAMAPNPAPEDESFANGMSALLMNPPAMAIAIPSGPFPASLLENILDTTNAPAPGEWASNEDGDQSYSYRDNYAFVAITEAGRALAEKLVAAKPARPDALFEMALDEPSEFQKRLDFGSKEEAMTAAFDSVAEQFGLPGFGEKLKVLVAASEKADRETERVVVDAWFDATNGLAFAASLIAREGSDLAARIAAAPALDPAALPGVPAGAPFWVVQSAAESPDTDTKALLGAIRSLFEGPAPSGDETATAQRAAVVRAIDANRAAIPAVGAVALYATADSEGRPAFVADTRLRDAAPARALLDAQAALLGSFPALASNGVAVVREGPGALRIDISTADAFVGLARLGYELEKLAEDDDEEDDDGSDLWVDDDEEDETEENGEDGEKAEEAAKSDGDGEDDDEDAADDDDEEFDEEEVRKLAKQVADVLGETIVVRDEIAEDGSSEKSVVSAPGAKLPAAQGVPDLAPALALGKALLPGGAKPVGAGAFSCRAAAAAFLPAFVRLSAAMDDPMDEDDIAKAKAFAAGDADFGFRFLTATEGRALRIAFAMPRADIEAMAKLLAEAAEKEDASFDLEDGDEEDDDEDADDDAA